MAGTMERTLRERLPTDNEAEKARQAATVLAQRIEQDGTFSLRLNNGTKGKGKLELPPAVAELVLELLLHIGRNESVTLVPFGAELTTQAAADMLNVSRPFLIKLIETGSIPHHKVGSHRRLKACDVLEYKSQRDAERNDAMTELIKLGQEIDAN